MPKESEFKDEINSRLEKATPVELDRMREFLKLKPSSNIDDITSEYRLSAGNSIVNVGRRLNRVTKITYGEILVDVIEKIRPVEENFQSYVGKVRSIFSRKWHLSKQQSKPTIEELEQLLMDIANKKMSDALENMGDDAKREWELKAKNEVNSSKSNIQGLMNPHANITNVFGSVFSVAVSRGVFVVAGGTISAAASAILIPAAFSGPAYRKTVNATLDLIMIGRRQAAELGGN